MNKNKDYLITEKPSRALFAFALPMIIGNLFQQAYTIVDSAIVGHYVGETALAAVGASYALTSIFICVAIGGGISSQPLLIETLDRVYEEQILKGHPFSEEQARSLAHPEIVACAFHNKSNQIGALVSYQNAFYPQK